MTKNNKLFLLLLVAALILGAGGLFTYNRYVSRQPNTAGFIEKIRKENKAGFDSLQNAINYENSLNSRIEESINAGDFKTAYSLMDSLPAFGKKYSMLLYQGMIYEKQKKYSAAIKEYTSLIRTQPFPVVLNRRAGIYVITNKLDFALHDYQKAASLNYDYNMEVASTFILMNKKDSALKYYQIFLEHYPNDTAIQQKINSLKRH